MGKHPSITLLKILRQPIWIDWNADQGWRYSRRTCLNPSRGEHQATRGGDRASSPWKVARSPSWEKSLTTQARVMPEQDVPLAPKDNCEPWYNVLGKLLNTNGKNTQHNLIFVSHFERFVTLYLIKSFKIAVWKYFLLYSGHCLFINFPTCYYYCIEKRDLKKSASKKHTTYCEACPEERKRKTASTNSATTREMRNGI